MSAPLLSRLCHIQQAWCMPKAAKSAQMMSRHHQEEHVGRMRHQSANRAAHRPWLPPTPSGMRLQLYCRQGKPHNRFNSTFQTHAAVQVAAASRLRKAATVCASHVTIEAVVVLLGRRHTNGIYYLSYRSNDSMIFNPTRCRWLVEVCHFVVLPKIAGVCNTHCIIDPGSKTR
jgi:hypothetical protein